MSDHEVIDHDNYSYANEDDGYIALWSYELHNGNAPVALILFDAKELDSMVHIQVLRGYYIPYSVHSWMHADAYNPDDALDDADINSLPSESLARVSTRA